MPLKPVMNAEKLKRLQTQVRIGGKGTPRRKKKVIHQTAAADDKKLQSSLKKLSVSTIPGIEEVNIIKDDLTVIHFNNPKAQASLSANTFAVTGHGETKKVVEMLPEILPQLGQDNVSQLRMLANSMTTNQKEVNGGRFGPNVLGSIDEDDVPVLVNDFDEIAKKEDLTKGKPSKDDSQQSKYFAPSNVQSQPKEVDADHNDSNDNVVTISLPKPKNKNEQFAPTGEVNQVISKSAEDSETASSPSNLALIEKKTNNKIKNDKIVAQTQKDKKFKTHTKTSDDLDNEFNESLNVKGDVSFEATIILENLPLNEVNPVDVDNYAYRPNTENTSSKNQNIVEIGVSHQGNGVQQISLNVGSKDFIREQNKQIKNDSEESKAIAVKRPGEISNFNEDLDLQPRSQSQSREDPDSICVIGVEGNSSSPIRITVSISHNNENNNDYDEKPSEQVKAIDKTSFVDADVETQQIKAEAITLSPINQENKTDDKKEVLAPKITGPPVVCVERKQIGSNQGKEKEPKPKNKVSEVQQTPKNKSPRPEDKKENKEAGKATNTKQVITPIKKQTSPVEGISPADTNKILTAQKKTKSEPSEKVSNDQPNTPSPATPPKTPQKSNTSKTQTATKESAKQQTKSSALSSTASTATKSPTSPKKSDTTAKPKVTSTKSPSPSTTGGTVQKAQPSPKTSTNAGKTEKVTASPKSKVPSSPSAKQQTTMPSKSPSSAKKGQAPSSSNPSNSSLTQSRAAETVAQAKLKSDGNITKEKNTGETKS